MDPIQTMIDKWAEVLDESEVNSAARVGLLSKEGIMARVLENQENWCNQNVNVMNEAAPPTTTASGGQIATWAPILVRMAKRSQQALISMDFFGTQPASAPDTLIFAMRARYGSQTGPEALYNKPNTAFSGTGSETGSTSGFTAALLGVVNPALVADPATGTAMTTASAEALGSTVAWGKMSVSVEKQTVSVGSRGLYADYTNELRQDLMAVHGENVDEILSQILVNEILSEMNREFITRMNIAARVGAKSTANPGIFNLVTDSDGRWMMERMKSLLFRIEQEANAVSIATRRGKANRVLTTPNVASAMQMAGMLDFSPALAANAELNIDPSAQVFAGVLANGMKVYVDPFSDVNYVTVGYKGDNEMDAGIYYVPYTPLEMYTGKDPETMQPRMAFKTRYAVCANPFFSKDAAGVAFPGNGLGQNSNGYFRKFLVSGLELAEY